MRTQRLKVIELFLAKLRDGQPAGTADIPSDLATIAHSFQLITAKPVLYVANVGEDTAASGNEHTRRVAEMADQRGMAAVTISAAIEAEVAQLEEASEQAAFLEDLGLTETGLNRVVRAGYELLDLITCRGSRPQRRCSARSLLLRIHPRSHPGCRPTGCSWSPS